MLLIDGVRYELWAPTSEEELEGMVQEHAGDIFGPDCLYFGLKHKLKAKSGGAVPDGYAITFNPEQWWIVEIELSTHDVLHHIVPQVSKFLASVPVSGTKADLINVLWREINDDKIMLAKLRQQKGEDIHKWLSDLISQQPKLAVVIDEKVPALEDVKTALRIEPTVLEFCTFAREGVGLAVHAHSFDPLGPAAESHRPAEEPPLKAWSPDEFQQFWNSIKPDAQRVLKEIAKRPSGYPRDDLLKVLSLNGRTLAGFLSSVGHNMKVFEGVIRPMELDGETGAYKMPKEVAREIVKKP